MHTFKAYKLQFTTS